jgi:hypothetical protein
MTQTPFSFKFAATGLGIEINEELVGRVSEQNVKRYPAGHSGNVVNVRVVN